MTLLAVVLLLSLVTVSVAAIVATARALRVDGHRRTPTDPSRLP